MNDAKIFDLSEYLNLLKKWWWIPTTLALVFAVVSAVYSYYVVQKVYQANTSLYVVSKDNQDNTKIAAGDITLAGLLIKDYKELVKQRAISKEVIAELKLEDKLSIASLNNKITVDSKNDTRILQISVQDTSPQMAAILADKVAEVFTRKVIQTMKVENVQIIDNAEIPTSPVSPNPKREIPIAILFGIALGVGFILLIDYLDNTIKSPDDVKNILNLNTLATLPMIQNSTKKGEQSEENKIICVEEPKSSPAEQFRVLRTSIEFKAVDQELKNILVTSAGGEEGKTTTTINLAVVLAQAGAKVLIVDADLRKATVFKYFKLNPNKGLTVCIQKKGDPLDYIQKTAVENVDILTSGPVPPDATIILGSKAMKELVGKVAEKYDYVLYDSPPVGIVTDAAVLSRYCDGVIVVISSGFTKIISSKAAVDELRKVDAKLLGVVINKQKRKGPEYYYYYYGQKDERDVL